MSREKQIEEMAKDLCDIECKGMKCSTCDSYGCEYRMQAEALYNAGYRKQSEVEKIFEEIYRSVASKIPMEIRPIFKDDMDFDAGFINGKRDALLDVLVLITELEKKYTEEKDEV